VNRKTPIKMPKSKSAASECLLRGQMQRNNKKMRLQKGHNMPKNYKRTTRPVFAAKGRGIKTTKKKDWEITNEKIQRKNWRKTT
jgi:hypothetical protein